MSFISVAQVDNKINYSFIQLVEELGALLISVLAYVADLFTFLVFFFYYRN